MTTVPTPTVCPTCPTMTATVCPTLTRMHNNLQTGIIVVVAVDYKKLLDIIEKNNFERNTRNDAYVSSIHSLVIVFVLKT
jgi:hypothetical protein